MYVKVHCRFAEGLLKCRPVEMLLELCLLIICITSFLFFLQLEHNGLVLVSCKVDCFAKTTEPTSYETTESIYH